MEPESVACLVVATGWVVAAIGCLRAGRWAPATFATLVALAQGVVVVWPGLHPVAAAAWLACGLALPDGALDSIGRRAVVAMGTIGAGGWATGVIAVGDAGDMPAAGPVAVATALAAGGVLAGVAHRCRKASTAGRQVLQWVMAAAVTVGAAIAVLLALNVLIDTPGRLAPWVLGALVVAPIGFLLGQLRGAAQAAEQALVEAIVIAGLAVLVVAVYLVVVVGLGRAPVGSERDVLASSIVAALIVAVLALPARIRLTTLGNTLLKRGAAAPEQTLATFGARMSRAVPFDELLLQLAESLRATLGPSGAEVWVGSDGMLTRTVSVPDRPPERLELDDHERVVVGRTRIGGNSWLAVWLPGLIAPEGSDRADELVRVAPAAHGGDLLGLLVVRRPVDAAPFSDQDDRVLVDLARQVGLALHNVRLDSALQASLAELQQRNEELKASRLRIVAAADASRREIERNLHDGAQQHLVALSVKLGLVREMVGGTDEDRATAVGLVEELRTDVQGTVAALRELAHGIYPPLLRNHGLGQALPSASRRSALPCEVIVELADRYPEQVEAAVYFCCLEAIQNAGKHAGDGACVTVRVDTDGPLLHFSVTDDGAGFALGQNGSAAGHGFVNMADRLGAVGGRLHVESVPGQGTTIRGEIPATPRAAPVAGRSMS